MTFYLQIIFSYCEYFSFIVFQDKIKLILQPILGHKEKKYMQNFQELFKFNIHAALKIIFIHLIDENSFTKPVLKLSP